MLQVKKEGITTYERTRRTEGAVGDSGETDDGEWVVENDVEVRK